MAHPELRQEVERRRTFAIISHPDAGKTTLTEKLLLYGGAIQTAGAVKGKSADHHAVSDWMEMEKKRGISIIMDGRDIGTVVLPDATLKIYLTASAEVRALRRYSELREKGQLPLFHEVLDDLVERDYNDSHRAASPLQRAEDAVLLDTSGMTLKQSIDAVVQLAKEAIGG